MSPHDGAAEVRRIIEMAENVAPDYQGEVLRLATFPPYEYDRCRKTEAARLEVRVGTLDSDVERARGAGNAAGDKGGEDRSLRLADVEPWPEPVDGAALLNDLAQTIRRYIVLDQAAADATALWVVHTHAINAAYVSPRLAITSPEKRCGKTTLLTVLGALTARPLATANMTTATIFRIIEAKRPTLLIDEADSFLSDAEEMRGVINAGHCRATATVLRCVETTRSPDGWEVHDYDCWGAMALAAIGRLPGTIEDRAIKVAMRRRRPDEAVERLRLDRLAELTPLARGAARWAADHVTGLAATDPDVPAELHDRAADNWRALLAIADAAGGGWPARARSAAVTLARDGADDAETVRTMLLADLHGMFADEPGGVLYTAEILDRLHGREDRPWPEHRDGRPITARQMAALLRPLGITTNQTVRRGATTGKGYRAADLADAWSRYLPPTPSVTRSHAADSAAFSGNGSVTLDPAVTDRKDQNVSISAGRDRVTVRNAGTDGNKECHGDQWEVEL